MTRKKRPSFKATAPRALILIVVAVCVLVPISALAAQDGPQPAGFRDHQGVEVPVAFYYPASWMVVDQNESVGIVSRPALVTDMAQGRPALEDGDAILALGVMPTLFFQMMGAETDSLEAVVDVLYASIETGDGDGDVDEEDRERHSYPAGDAVSVLFDVPGQDPASMMIVARESPDVFAFGMAFGKRDDLAAFRDELAHVVATVEFTGTMEDFYQ